MSGASPLEPAQALVRQLLPDAARQGCCERLHRFNETRITGQRKSMVEASGHIAVAGNQWITEYLLERMIDYGYRDESLIAAGKTFELRSGSQPPDPEV